MAEARSGRRFAKTAGVFFVGTVLSKLSTIVLLPIYTRGLSPAEYGTYDLWFTIGVFLGPILFFQVWDGVYRFSFEGSNLKAVVTNGAVLMAWGLALYTVVMVSALLLSGVPAALPIFLFGASTAIQYFVGYLARSEFRNGLLMWTGVLNTVLGGALSVGLLVAGLGIDALFLGLSVGNAAQAAVIVIALRAQRYFELASIDRDLLIELLRFSLPLCIASAAYWMLSGFTRMALVWLDGPTANGAYAVADKFAFAMTLVSGVVLYAWQEFLYVHEKEGGDNDVRDYALRVIFRGILLSAAATLVAVSLTFDAFVGSSFESSYILVPLTVGAASLNAIANTAGTLFMAIRDTRRLLTTTVVASGVNVVLAVFLIPEWGAVGAGISLATAFAVLAGIRLVRIAHSHQLTWFDRHIALAWILLGMSLTNYFWGSAVGSAVIAVGVLGAATVTGGALVRGARGEAT